MKTSLKNLTIALPLAVAACAAAPLCGFSQEEPAKEKSADRQAISEGVVGDWTCNGHANDIYSIHKNKKVTHLADKGTWRISNGTLELRWDNGYRTVFEIEEIGDELVGKSYPPQRPDSPDPMVFQRVGQRPVEQPAATVPEPLPGILPVKREITDSAGRKMQVTILSKSEDAIRIRRDGDKREFEIPIAKLSEEDRKFLDHLGKPGEIGTATFKIEFSGELVEMTQLGSGPVGVLIFGGYTDHHTNALLAAREKFGDLLPDKISIFTSLYPGRAPFGGLCSRLAAYKSGDENQVRPDFTGVATGVLARIREKTGIKEFILVGNSVGVGVILWDYKQLVADPDVRFLLIAPAEAFMPPISSLGKLERTMLLATSGGNPAADGEIDCYLKGREARKWVETNMDSATIRQFSSKPGTDPDLARLNRNYDPLKMDFSHGHPIIGLDMEFELFAELLKRILKN